MTTEQNQPEASLPEGQAPQGQSQGQGHRRRRRRRKGNKPAAQANGQAAAPQGQQQHGQSNQGPKANKPSSQNRFFQKNGNGGGDAQQNGRGGGGGGRRKSKPRKQQVFVGPMDHSYRVANGNVADSPPSTIELRNGNINGNGHSHHSYANEAYSSHDHQPVVPIREDAPTRIYCFIEDLFVLAKIQETARKLGIKVGFVKAEKDIVAKLAEGAEQDRPSLIVFDLNNANAKPLTLIPKIRTKLKKGKTSIIGFLSHIQGDLKVKAVEAGCDVVMPRSSFSQNLPNLLRRHGLDEEEEFDAVQVQ
ncbi:CheY-like chemotaxis protein [Silvibacterium bohemicum]|uniref:CheY-like chemotaxis protein n=1 Tax=Silvibacterium bohemicum TaxID=1577686 RepID=A0A841K9K4_9BACT|nr:response regulator [Silvibacterium bohemicum]MBB6146964.1 CheY-like chemotaxis protein [Silvibacterium bohemicum]